MHIFHRNTKCVYIMYSIGQINLALVVESSVVSFQRCMHRNERVEFSLITEMIWFKMHCAYLIATLVSYVICFLGLLKWVKKINPKDTCIIFMAAIFTLTTMWVIIAFNDHLLGAASDKISRVSQCAQWWYDMMWCDVMWCDEIWYDMMYDMIYDMIWYDMIWYKIWYDIYDMLWYDMMIIYDYDMVWCGVVWYGMVWYGMVWYSIWYHKNITRHTAHTIVSWPNPKQWQMGHTSDLMMIIR